MLQNNQLLELQHTIADSITITCIGVHFGRSVSLKLHPATEGTGILFKLVQSGKVCDSVLASWSNVVGTNLSTILGSSSYKIHTTEHLMAALYAYGIDNVIIEMDESEVPIMDGSALAFVESIERVGIKALQAKRRFMRILKPVRVQNGDSWAEFIPCDAARFEISIQFKSNRIGFQKWEGNLTKQVFRDEICAARTFGFLQDVDQYRQAGYALGSSLENSIVISADDQIINDEGLRYSGEEFVRHKTLDAIGDIALSGNRLIGCYRSHRVSHKINYMALCALFADKNSYEMVEDYVYPDK
ncbi:UDP-3-O-(3-hydroxymyristoyl) glucosamine N-acyltransferase [Candidatus Liberibacter solanacearum]|uniref:UDP-3-O-acyl-N-acetylglucosamine deacetylase n=1 Tax=Candidatus Liberibacter solanacearum TaxID=556287 RepID=UPI0004FFFA97|nr:UDP-3-O-acyl-N-acetylglucosamine deacetylase [Candidatus Liberibacter solanacearum]KGB27660.1 UDP-3-O-(3-hydroxymyristoyl) glucosamine N-acyltransferase [Candidatus Liberibacter solanacearum]